MPVQPMMCPRCGKEATEYDENKWQCLNPRCGAKFIYESPPETVRQEISISNTIKGATFTCCGCGGIFPMLQYPQYQCARCGEFFCSECKSKGRPITGRRGRDGFQCKHCVQRAKWRGALAAILLGGSLFGILLSSKKEDRPPISPPPLKKEDRPPILPPLALDPKLALAYNNRGDAPGRNGRQSQSASTGMSVTLGVMPDYADEAKAGLKISGVRNGGPAAKAGLKGNDSIIRIGGKPIATIYDYMESMKGYKPGDKVEVVVRRDGAEVKLRVDLGAPTAPPRN